MLKESKKQDIIEKAIVSLGFVGIFLPVRLLFYTYVTKYWLGSLGIISIIAFLVTYLSHKDKLGKFGRLWKKQIHKIARGKLGTFFLIQSIFYMIFFFLMVQAMTYGQGYDSFEAVKTILEEERMLGDNPGENLEQMQEIVEDADLRQLFSDALEGANVFVSSDPQTMISSFVVAVAVLDYWAGGWFQHFYIIFFVEEIEKLGLIIYFRWFYKGKIAN